MEKEELDVNVFLKKEVEFKVAVEIKNVDLKELIFKEVKFSEEKIILFVLSEKVNEEKLVEKIILD